MKIINWLLTFAMSGLVFFLSAFLFLGGLEGFEALKENLLRSFVIRFGSVYIVVILCVAAVYFGNILFLNLQSKTVSSTSPRRVALRTLLVLSLADLLGTSIFFFG